MNSVTSPVERGLTKTPTGDKEERRADGLETDDEEDEDEEEEEEEEDDAPPARDPAKDAFEEILTMVRNRQLEWSSKPKPERKQSDNPQINRQEFIPKYRHHLAAQIDKKKTILHVLAYEAKPNMSLRSLVKYLVKYYPKLMLVKDQSNKTPLYVAITERKPKLVTWMAEGCQNIEEVLRNECDRDDDFCLHAAIRSKLPPDVIINLITKAAEATLGAEDREGCTPLHLAVAYDKCTDSQFEVVKALIDKCDAALDKLTKPPDSYSVYQYHDYTRVKAQSDAKRATAARHEGEPRPADDPNIKQTKGLRELKAEAPPKKSKDSPKDNAQGTKDEREPKSREDAVLKRRDSNFHPQAGQKEQPLSVQHGHQHRSKETQAALNSTQIATPESPIVGTNATFAIPQLPRGKENSGQKWKAEEESIVTEASADKIKNEIKLHYLRKRSPDVAMSRLYGKNPNDIQICFDYFESGAPAQIDAQDFKESFENVVFDEVLEYVAFPSVTVLPQPRLSESPANSMKLGRGRTDMLFFFQWLREKKSVKRILKVIVDDEREPAHSDEAIEKALKGFGVEILDWRKVDLCPQTICAVSDKLREVYLRWSGNNTVLRAWSEPDGLKKLEDLSTVHLDVRQDLETSNRTTLNTDEFRRRLRAPLSLPGTPLSPTEQAKVPQRNIEVYHIEKGGRERLLTSSPSALANENMQEQTIHPHKWLDCMDKFADMIQNVWPATLKQILSLPPEKRGSLPAGLQKPVEIALIDDGVDMYHPPLRKKISSGKSFDYGDKTQNQMRYYGVSAGGHGTVMASMICRVCPIAKIYAIRLETHPSDTKPQINVRSAAMAIEAAVDRKVQIICMSWTVKEPPIGEDKERFDKAMARAVTQGILIFCAAGDAGLHQDTDYPAACSPSKLFRIGAAKADGHVWSWAGNLASLDFIIPGHDVVERQVGDAPPAGFQPQTGSSVANALAAGLAALIISCVKLAAIHTHITGHSATAVATRDVQDVMRFEKMKAAFKAIGTSEETKNKFVEVWNMFDEAGKEFRGWDREKRLEMVADLARGFVRK